MKLSRYEQETIITFNAEKDIASIYTLDPVWQRKLDRLAEKSPSFYMGVTFVTGSQRLPVTNDA